MISVHVTPCSSPSPENRPERISSFDCDSSPVSVSTAEVIVSDSVSVTAALWMIGCELLTRADKRMKERRSLAVASLAAWKSCQWILKEL